MPQSDNSGSYDIMAQFRESLHPRTLPEVERQVVRTVHLPAIRNGLDGQGRRAHAIVGEAGSGKSTALGQIYDALSESSSQWAALLPCTLIDRADPPDNQDQLDQDLGRLISPRPDSPSLTQLVSGAARENRRPTVLIDTVDLILGDDSVRAVAGLLSMLINEGASVVFTCRTYEFEARLQPTRDRLAATNDTLAIHRMPLLDTHEIRQFVGGYLHKNGLNPIQGVKGFIDALIDVSSDGRPLRKIIINPHLLAMLCAVFANDLVVPADLTTSELYEQYWHSKVSQTRRHDPDTQVANSKEAMAHDIAAKLWERSRTHLVETLPDVLIASDKRALQAKRDLLSEGVLIRLRKLGGPELAFHHQTLAEYAMARYMWAFRGDGHLDDMLRTLAATPDTQLHWLPVVRQIVAMAAAVDMRDLESLLGRLRLDSLAAFRAATFGLAQSSTGYGQDLLASVAIRYGKEFEDALLDAVAVAPTATLGQAADAATQILAYGHQSNASTAAQVIGWLSVRSVDRDQLDLSAAIDAIERWRERIKKDDEGFRRLNSDWPDQLLDNLISPAIDRAIPLTASNLDRLCDSVFRTASEMGTRLIVNAHLVNGVDPKDRVRLSDRIMASSEPPIGSECVADFLATQLSWAHLADRPTKHDVDRVIAFLEEPRGSSWAHIQHRLVGRLATQSDALTDRLVDVVFSQQASIAHHSLMALKAFVVNGDAVHLSRRLCERLDRRVDVETDLLPALVKVVGERLPTSERHLLAAALKPMVIANVETMRGTVEKMLDAFAGLIYDDYGNCMFVIEASESLSSRSQQRLLANLLKLTPPSMAARLQSPIDRTLDRLNASVYVANLRARLYGRAAPESAAARQALLDVAVSGNVLASKQALHQIVRAAEDGQPWLVPQFLVRLLDVDHERLHLVVEIVDRVVSEGAELYSGVTLRALQLSREAMDRSSSLSRHVDLVVATISLCHSALRRGVPSDARAEPSIRGLVDLWLADLPEDPGVRRGLIAMLKTVAYHQNHELPTERWLMSYLDLVDLADVGDGEAFAKEALDRLVMHGGLSLHDLAAASRGWTPANRCVVVRLVAMRDAGGARSELLDDIMREGPPASVRSEILRLRGL